MNLACLLACAVVIFNPLERPTVAEFPKTDQLWCTYEPGEGVPVKHKHIVLISGDEEYRSEEALPMLGKILSQHHGYKCTVLFPMDEDNEFIDPNNQQNIPGMHHLQDADLVIMALRFRALPDDQMKYFDEYLMAGKPIIGLRTSTHAFRFGGDVETSFRKYGGSSDWKGGFGKQVLGETWVNHHGHHGRESTRGVINPDARGHVLLTGVTDVWGPTDVYGIRELPEGCTVLLHGQVVNGMSANDPPTEGEKNDPMMPLAWVRTWTNSHGKDCSIFCTTMGSSTDFESAGLRRLIVNTAFQMTGMEDEITESLNVDYVNEYKPTPFGFNRFQENLKPADFNLK